MHTLAILAQLAVAAAVLYVWTFRFPNIVRDFEQFRYPAAFRTAVGAAKVALATLLIVGVWLPSVAVIAALGMAAFMLGAQWAHAGVHNPLPKRLPSALLLLLSVFVAAESAGLLG